MKIWPSVLAAPSGLVFAREEALLDRDHGGLTAGAVGGQALDQVPLQVAQIPQEGLRGRVAVREETARQLVLEVWPLSAEEEEVGGADAI